jgi:hypothetical protein
MLSAGAYLDYGLNNIINANSQPFVAYNKDNPRSFAVNSILNSQYTQDGKLLVKDIKPLTAGIKLSLSFGMGKN